MISGSSSSKTTIADPNALVGEERISSAYFLTPNYDAIVDYPESSTSATYDGWRRSKIKSAMKVLKGKYLL